MDEIIKKDARAMRVLLESCVMNLSDSMETETQEQVYNRAEELKYVVLIISNVLRNWEDGYFKDMSDLINIAKAEKDKLRKWTWRRCLMRD